MLPVDPPNPVPADIFTESYEPVVQLAHIIRLPALETNFVLDLHKCLADHFFRITRIRDISPCYPVKRFGVRFEKYPQAAASFC